MQPQKSKNQTSKNISFAELVSIIHEDISSCENSEELFERLNVFISSKQEDLRRDLKITREVKEVTTQMVLEHPKFYHENLSPLERALLNHNFASVIALLNLGVNPKGTNQHTKHPYIDVLFKFNQNEKTKLDKRALRAHIVNVERFIVNLATAIQGMTIAKHQAVLRSKALKLLTAEVSLPTSDKSKVVHVHWFVRLFKLLPLDIFINKSQNADLKELTKAKIQNILDIIINLTSSHEDYQSSQELSTPNFVQATTDSTNQNECRADITRTIRYLMDFEIIHKLFITRNKDFFDTEFELGTLSQEDYKKYRTWFGREILSVLSPYFDYLGDFVNLLRSNQSILGLSIKLEEILLQIIIEKHFQFIPSIFNSQAEMGSIKNLSESGSLRAAKIVATELFILYLFSEEKKFNLFILLKNISESPSVSSQKLKIDLLNCTIFQWSNLVIENITTYDFGFDRLYHSSSSNMLTAQKYTITTLRNLITAAQLPNGWVNLLGDSQIYYNYLSKLDARITAVLSQELIRSNSALVKFPNGLRLPLYRDMADFTKSSRKEEENKCTDINHKIMQPVLYLLAAICEIKNQPTILGHALVFNLVDGYLATFATYLFNQNLHPEQNRTVLEHGHSIDGDDIYTKVDNVALRNQINFFSKMMESVLASPITEKTDRVEDYCSYLQNSLKLIINNPFLLLNLPKIYQSSTDSLLFGLTRSQAELLGKNWSFVVNELSNNMLTKSAKTSEQDLISVLKLLEYFNAAMILTNSLLLHNSTISFPSKKEGVFEPSYSVSFNKKILAILQEKIKECQIKMIQALLNARLRIAANSSDFHYILIKEILRSLSIKETLRNLSFFPPMLVLEPEVDGEIKNHLLYDFIVIYRALNFQEIKIDEKLLTHESLFNIKILSFLYRDLFLNEQTSWEFDCQAIFSDNAYRKKIFKQPSAEGKSKYIHSLPLKLSNFAIELLHNFITSIRVDRSESITEEIHKLRQRLISYFLPISSLNNATTPNADQKDFDSVCAILAKIKKCSRSEALNHLFLYKPQGQKLGDHLNQLLQNFSSSAEFLPYILSAIAYAIKTKRILAEQILGINLFSCTMDQPAIFLEQCPTLLLIQLVLYCLTDRRSPHLTATLVQLIHYSSSPDSTKILNNFRVALNTACALAEKQTQVPNNDSNRQSLMQNVFHLAVNGQQTFLQWLVLENEEDMSTSYIEILPVDFLWGELSNRQSSNPYKEKLLKLISQEIAGKLVSYITAEENQNEIHNNTIAFQNMISLCLDSAESNTESILARLLMSLTASNNTSFVENIIDQKISNVYCNRPEPLMLFLVKRHSDWQRVIQAGIDVIKSVPALLKNENLKSAVELWEKNTDKKLHQTSAAYSGSLFPPSNPEANQGEGKEDQSHSPRL